MAGINLILQNNPNITGINCGTSSPRLSGTIDISAFPSLTSFNCNFNNITSFTGLENTPNIASLGLESNLLTGAVPSFSANPLLRTLWVPRNNFTSIPNSADYAQLRTIGLHENSLLTGNLPPLSTNVVDAYFHACRFTGPIPTLSGCTNLNTYYAYNQLGTTKLTGTIPQLPPSIVNFLVHTNQLTGSIPSLTGLTLLRDFRVQINQLTGPIPSLSGLTSLEVFRCENQTGTIKLTGSIPSLTGLTRLLEFRCHTNQLTGSIPSLSGLTLLREFSCHTNQLTGSIPSLSGLTRLQNAYFSFNQLTGAIPSLSNLTDLRDFSCSDNQLTSYAGGTVSNTLGRFVAQNNQLTSAAVNALLAAFVAAGRTTGTPVVNGTCILNLGGAGNFRPTGQGVTDVTTLRNRGWTVTTGTL